MAQRSLGGRAFTSLIGAAIVVVIVSVVYEVVLQQQGGNVFGLQRDQEITIANWVLVSLFLVTFLNVIITYSRRASVTDMSIREALDGRIEIALFILFLLIGFLVDNNIQF